MCESNDIFTATKQKLACLKNVEQCPPSVRLAHEKEPQRKENNFRHLEDTYEKLINQITAEEKSPQVPPNTEMPSGSNSIPTDVNQSPTNVLSSNSVPERPVYPIYDDSTTAQINIWKLTPCENKSIFPFKIG